MNKEKQQIEEMKKWSAIKEMELAIRNKTESCQTCTWYKNGVCDDSCELAEDNQKICVDLYNANYRKQSEGEWMRYPHGSGIYCSLCKHKRRYRDINDAFCPNCGAKMKGGEE